MLASLIGYSQINCYLDTQTWFNYCYSSLICLETETRTLASDKPPSETSSEEDSDETVVEKDMIPQTSKFKKSRLHYFIHFSLPLKDMRPKTRNPWSAWEALEPYKENFGLSYNCIVQIKIKSVLLVYEAVWTTINGQVGWWGYVEGSFGCEFFLSGSMCAERMGCGRKWVTWVL